MSTTNKKAKTEGSTEVLSQFEAVRNHLMNCPNLSTDHPAIQAALEGLDKEKKRIERDMKLKRKFQKDMNEPVTVERPKSQSAGSLNPSTHGQRGADVPENSASTEADDWQDIAEDKSTEASSSPVGIILAKEVVTSISHHDARASSPLAAITLALHAAMVGDTIGFVCTGIHSEKTQSGFAKPIREISTFLPEQWQASPNVIQLRYRKRSNGAVVLKVSLTEHSSTVTDAVVEITVTPVSSPEPKDILVVAIGDHVNLDSWSKAAGQDSQVAPALHYKKLSDLMTKFVKYFDLGFDAGNGGRASEQYVDSSVLYPTTHFEPQHCRVQHPQGDGYGPHIDTSFPGLVGGGNRGLFAGDLTPGGIRGPGLPGMDPSQGGNLMGPNHPAFHPGVPGPLGGGMGMQPRFDPFGPPQPDDGTAPSRGRRPTGEPNPDHMRPPNNLGNNMFM